MRDFGTQPQVFYDPTGRRRRVATTVLLLLGVLIVAAGWYGRRVLLRMPPVTTLDGHLNEGDGVRQLEFQKKRRISGVLSKQVKRDLANQIKATELLTRTRRIHSEIDPSRAVWAFYDSEDSGSYFSYLRHRDLVTDLVVVDLVVSPDSYSVNLRELNDFQRTRQHEILQVAATGSTRVYGYLADLQGTDSDPISLERLAKEPALQKAFIAGLIQVLHASHLAGVVINLQTVQARELHQLVYLLTEVKRSFEESTVVGPLEKHAVATAPLLGAVLNLSQNDSPLWRFGSIFDRIILRADVPVSNQAAPGPIAAEPSFAHALDLLLRNIPVERFVLAFDNHFHDWNLTDHTSVDLSYLRAMNLAERVRGPIDEGARDESDYPTFDPVSSNFMFKYVETKQGIREEHEVWGSDAVSSLNQYLLAYRAGVRQIGVWSIGLEDPGVWAIIAHTSDFDAAATALTQIVFPFDFQVEGKGDEIVTRSGFQDGLRTVRFGDRHELIEESRYVRFPSKTFFDRRGYEPRKLALTFDDGPVAPFTSDILDILKRRGVKATFFVIGERIQENPGLLERMYAEGHDIGNHTFTHPDLSAVTINREKLELNATQRFVQSILGHSLVLFRPPYFSEDSPLSLDEARVIRTAAELGYRTIGLAADAQDWELYRKDENGKEVRRTGRDLADAILDALDTMKGSAILLHDGPADREATVDAVDLLIPELQARGYQIVPVSELIGASRDEIMPEVKTSDLRIGFSSLYLSSLYIEAIFLVRSVFEIALILVTVFGVTRLICFLTLALKSLRHESPFQKDAANFAPPVSIIVAAYNEEKVILRTLKSLLCSEYPEFEILVVDDGSKDKTSELLRSAYADHPKVRLFTKPNAGKSSALNVGIEHSKYDFIISLDADTQYTPTAIAAMMRHFADPSVGSVAGNVKVGNRNSWFLQCQSLEYITNQNVGRRAFGYLDAITVVPGAAGAWRKSAVLEVGRFASDTLGEDMELTWRVRKAGYRIKFEPQAYAYTEAPDNFAAFFTQRFRWIYSQFQVTWKHRDVFFRSQYGWFGWFGAPLVFLEGIFLFLSPLADIQALFSLHDLATLLFVPTNFRPEQMANAAPSALVVQALILYAIFFAVEVGFAVFSLRLEKESVRPVWLLFFKQFFYRQLMYIVAYRAFWRAVTGWRQSWGVMDRSGSVELPSS